MKPDDLLSMPENPNQELKGRQHRIAEDFFGYLGKHLPQQCASDEFYFLPRSETAIHHLDTLDDMLPEKIQDHVGYVQGLLRELKGSTAVGLEAQIDGRLLKQSMDSFVREYEHAEIWRTDPTLYVKIPLLAIGHILSREDRLRPRAKADLLELLRQTPTFLRQAAENLILPPRLSLHVAQEMAQDAIHFHSHDMVAFIERSLGGDETLSSENEKVLNVWDGFRRTLLKLPARDAFAVGKEGLREILSRSLCYRRTPSEIGEVAREAYRKTLAELRAQAARIDHDKTWQEIIYERAPTVASAERLVQLFREQVLALRHFFLKQDRIPFPAGEKLRVLRTPHYLKSLRATASYCAPLTGTKGAQGVFHVNPSEHDLGIVASHSPYISAHETYPGHHLLDQFRISHSNPTRRQIESPLFYEGWACYAEQLLDELGYIEGPCQRLVGLKRRLWRNLRAALDVELQTGAIGLRQGAEQIQALGFAPDRAWRQIRRFALTPGYQLCYALGTFEIEGLRSRFLPDLGFKAFHKVLLSGGQLPIQLTAKRLAAKCEARKDGKKEFGP
jgi:hypothetical protein